MLPMDRLTYEAIAAHEPLDANENNSTDSDGSYNSDTGSDFGSSDSDQDGTDSDNN